MKHFFKKTLLTFEEYRILHLTPPVLTSKFESIFNLSSTTVCLNDDFLDMVKNGSKHIPIPKDISNEYIYSNIKKFVNNCLWSYYFKDEPEDPTFDPKFHVKKGTPFNLKLLNENAPIFKPLQKMKTLTKMFMYHFKPRQQTPNGLKLLNHWLKQNALHVITLSDKNLGFTIMDIKSYETASLIHLSNPKVYQKITTSNTDFRNMVFFKEIVDNYLNLLDEIPLPPNLRKYLEANRQFSLPKFHILPKIHKQKIPVPTRPIVGSLNWITTPFSKVLDVLIQPLLKNQDFILKNSNQLTQDLLQKFPRLTSNQLLVTLDIESLYTNIDLNQLELLLLSENETLSKMCQFITKNNYFSFGNDIYKQIDGLAMGTNAAVNLANYYLAKLLDPHIGSHSKVRYYKRYIDDLFFIWEGTESDLLDFKYSIDKLIPNIRFTCSHSPSSINFLDLTIFSTNEELHYKVFHKEISKYLYLTPKSFHPRQTLKGMIVGEILRYQRNSSHECYFRQSKRDFYIRLLKRGYSDRFLSSIFLKYQWDSKKDRTQEKKRVLPLVLPFSLRPGYQSLCLSLKEELKHIEYLLPQYRCLLAYSKSNNLSQILCKSSLTPEQIDYLKKTE